MSNVKKIKVGSTSYDCKDATARTQVGRINLTKSGNNLVFTDSNGTQHTLETGGFKWKYATEYYNYPDHHTAIYDLQNQEIAFNSGNSCTGFGITCSAGDSLDRHFSKNVDYWCPWTNQSGNNVTSFQLHANSQASLIFFNIL